MVTRHPLPSAGRLRELFAYDPETGFLTAKHDKLGRRGSWEKGDKLGYLDAFGYLKVTVDGRPYFVHRVAWKLMTRNEPPKYTDHVNLDKSDNRWVNLREATASQNAVNRDVMSVNTSGRKGVTLMKQTGKWAANVVVDGKNTHIGTFCTPEEAGSAYETVAKGLHKEFFRPDTGPLKLLYTQVYVVDQQFTEVVERAVGRILRHKLGAGLPPEIQAKLDEIALDLTTELARVEPERLGHMRKRESITKK